MNRYEVSRSILDTYVQDIHLHHPMSGYRSIRDFLAFDNFLVMKPAERLLKKTESTEHQVLLHSDQGVQYSSAGYCN